MFIKDILAEGSDLEIELQTIASRYGFSPNIISTEERDGRVIIFMDDIGEMSLASAYGDDAQNIPEWIWDAIRSMVRTLYEEEGIEYRDITPYNFIEKDDKIYMIDFGDAKYKDEDPIDWFLDEFLEGSNSWNPDYT